uniref:Uncharacterized protein LOC100177065 n=1 Tax=Phallusia mammillata TaxID=59560 RepID=A0A6F9DHB4_9ASCI|nr:uncharacterized protein LOC100177065 [Phallusia mammillata]
MEISMPSPQKPTFQVLSSKKEEPESADGGAGDASNMLTEEPQGTQELAVQQIQTIMQDLEQKREADKQMMEDFRHRMTEMVEQTCEKLEQKLMSQCEETNKQLEVKLQYLYSIVGSVCELEGELSDFKSAMSVLFKDVTTT